MKEIAKNFERGMNKMQEDIERESATLKLTTFILNLRWMVYLKSLFFLLMIVILLGLMF